MTELKAYPSSRRHSTPLSPITSHTSTSSSATGEPSQTFHPNRRVSLQLPHFEPFHALESIAGGAHFTAVADDVANTSPTHHRRASSHGSRGEFSPTLSARTQSPPLEAASSDASQPVVLEGPRKRVMEDVLQLFGSHPTLEIFKRSWRKDAVFEDPLSKCAGYHEYAAQWYGLAKLFPKSRTLSTKVVESTYGPIHLNRIVYEQEQEYTLRGLRLKKVIKSIVIIDLDEDDMITRLEDRWGGDELPHRWGVVYLRRLNAKTLPLLVRPPHNH